MFPALAAEQNARRAAEDRAEHAEAEATRLRTLVGTLEHALAVARGLPVTVIRTTYTDTALPRR